MHAGSVAGCFRRRRSNEGGCPCVGNAKRVVGAREEIDVECLVRHLRDVATPVFLVVSKKRPLSTIELLLGHLPVCPAMYRCAVVVSSCIFTHSPVHTLCWLVSGVLPPTAKSPSFP